MTATTKRKMQAVIDAIDELFGNTHVTPEETLEALEEVQSDVDAKIDALRGDIKDGRDS